jgi:outer membrane immunogenic protein
MKTALLTTAAFVVLGSTAMAADLPMTKAPMVPAPVVSDWTGFYFGGHGGFGWSDTSVEDPFTLTGVTFTPLFSAPKGSGWVAGGHFGYNWQYYGAVVAGLEADIDAADISDSQTVSGGGASATLVSKVDMLATARARLGYLVTPWLLLYGTGGAAWGHAEVNMNASGFGITAGQSTNLNEFGWVGGLGVEGKVWDHWLWRVEYLHYDFAKTAVTFPIQNVGTVFFNTNAQSTVDVVRAGLSFKL